MKLLERIPAAAALLERVGGTPLVPLEGLDGQAPGTRIHAKLESLNPTGSIKDRPVARMIVDAWEQGRFREGRRLLDSSSGNAGIAYAALGAAFGVGVTLVVPGNASRERLERIRAHGAELVLTDPIAGYDFAIEEARRLAGQSDRFVYLDQYGNGNNPRAHHDGTAGEVLAQLDRLGERPDAFVAGVGTGGTITGVARRLRAVEPALRVAAVIPEIFPGIEGLKPLGSPQDLVPANLDESLIDERSTVTSEEAAARCRELAARGLYVGPSSGAFVEGAVRLTRSGHLRVVTLLPDTGERYGSTDLWGESAPSCPAPPAA